MKKMNDTMLVFHKFICTACGHEWELPPAFGQQDICPACSRERVRRIDAGIRQQGCGATGRQHDAVGRP
jgi:hypothetical protein